MRKYRKFQIFLTLLLALTLKTFLVNGQSLPFDFFLSHVEFELYHSLRIPNQHVKIDIDRSNDSIVSMHVISNPAENSTKWAKTKIDTIYILDLKIFREILIAILKITKIDVTKAITIGLDGTSCTLAFGSLYNDISFTFWSPDYDTKERDLTYFVEACDLIIKTAKLKPKDIY
jgi:hypothetical protein